MEPFQGVPKEFIAQFERERSKCDLFFVEQRATLKERDHIELLIGVYIELVYGAFLQVLCDYAFSDHTDFSSSELRRRADFYLPQLIQTAWEEKQPRAGAFDSGVWKRSFIARVTTEIHSSDEWHKFLENVLALGEWETSSQISESSEGGTSANDDRALLINEYKASGKVRNIKITDAMIAKAANPRWNDRTAVQRWKARSKRSTSTEDALIRKVLRNQPHLKN